MNKLLSIILFFACSYDGVGVTDSPKTNSSSSSSTTLISTTEIEVTTTTGNQTTSIESSSSLNPTTENNITSTTEINTNTTDTITTTSTDSSSTTLELTTTTNPIERCGDCIMQENEECDWCIYEYIPGLSSCRQRDGRIIKQCWIELGPTTLWAGKPLEGMVTPEYDKEEADLLCQIKTRTSNVEAINYKINQGTNPFYNIILPENVNGLGYLLKTIDDIYSNQKLYYFNNKDIPNGFETEAFLYADSCVTI